MDGPAVDGPVVCGPVVTTTNVGSAESEEVNPSVKRSKAGSSQTTNPFVAPDVRAAASKNGNGATSPRTSRTRSERKTPTKSATRSPKEPKRPNPGGGPASRRALRSQGRITMRRLMDAAMVSFDKRGYHATRVNDIVEIAKTSHGTFYLYFSNKEDLVKALVIEVSTEASNLILKLRKPPIEETSWEFLRSWIGDYSALWSRYAPLFRSWTDLTANETEFGEQIQHTVNALTEAMASRITNPELDPGVAGMAVVAMLDRFHYMRELTFDPVESDALDTLTTFVYRALFK